MQVSIRQNYQKFIVPPPLVGQDKTQVKLGMVLSQIMDIRSVAEENLTTVIFDLFIYTARSADISKCSLF